MAVTVAAGGAKRSRLVRNELLLFSVLILIGFAVWTLYLFHARFGRKRSRLAMLYVFRSQCRKAPHFLKVSTSLLGVWKRLSFSIKSTETMEKNKVGKFVVMIQFLSNIVPLYCPLILSPNIVRGGGPIYSFLSQWRAFHPLCSILGILVI